MKKIIVVGNGMVGYKFCEKLIEQTNQDFDISIIGEESNPAYDRVHLSEYFENESITNLTLAPLEWYRDNKISLHLGQLVVAIDTQKQTVTTHKKEVLQYDYLVLATGSSPFVPPIEGKNKAGVYVYRTIEDLQGMLDYRSTLTKQKKPKAAVLGGGLLGLEAAKAALDMGLEAQVIEFADRLMPRQLDAAGSATLQRLIEELGIEILLNKNTKEILGDGHITGLSFADGTSLDTDMLIISAGIRPRDELAASIGLEKGPRGGIAVDEHMLTNIEQIYAIGEVASYNSACYGLVAPGYEMAQIAVDNILGKSTSMSAAVDMSTKLKLIGVDVASFGNALDEEAIGRSVVVEDRYNNIYKRINISKDGTKLLGGILVGDASEYNNFLQLFKNEMPLGENPEGLLIGNSESTGMGVSDLPDSAMICTCESITKGQICCSIKDDKCHTLKDLIKQTKAGTGCGGCKPMVTDIFDEELTKLGINSKKVICEHFDYTRQELYDLVKFKKVSSYAQLLEEYGNGNGCEKCKPLGASIFASLFNETAVVQEAIQDTNDRYLANIQRNGSYSVVPRVPGGEITPDKLIVLGEVAKKYKLYTKITGGQRIDLFGAKINDLPLIWKDLIDAGFESGHAYGKALRTVKSCVGSTWCRFGLDESVTFAIDLEDRYKGIRSPHKLKGGVSGCIRECAEARSKDFGVIATEAGWNLYVCGNGGANPKHAPLLAEGIDNETCIKYIDRFLMYYIRTAEPLQRTAAWLSKLKGGISYLKEIVVDDSLGICEELENEMKGLVNTYSCEWTEVVNNPKLQERFKHFVNSDEEDDNMVFVPMRNQFMPKPWK